MNIKNDPTILDGLEIYRAKRKLDIVETITGIVMTVMILGELVYLIYNL